jgi:protein tyrosine kinase
VLAIKRNIPAIETAPRAAAEGLDQSLLVRKLVGGLRAETWLGLGPGTVSSGQVVLIKRFFPHAPGAARDGLMQELELARRLEHPGIARTLHVGTLAERPFVIAEYLEGVTLQSLLLRASVTGARLSPAAVSRVLLTLVQAVAHGEARATSLAERQLVAQLIAAEDVFVTYDGAVKVLGFKSLLRATRWRAPGLELARDSTAPSAVDALLAEHFTPQLGAVLAAANDGRVRPLDRLCHVGRALTRWQAGELDSDGSAELATLLQALFPIERLQQRTWLDAALAGAVSADRSSDASATDLDEVPPQSGVRPIPSASTTEWRSSRPRQRH